MNLITPRTHGFLDLLTVSIFAAAPTALGLDDTAEALAYTLAVVHLSMSLATDYPLGIVKLVPYSMHLWVELMVSIVLVFLALTPLLVAPIAKMFFGGVGAVIFGVWLVSHLSKPSLTVEAV